MDDAIAFLACINAPNIEIVAITAVSGNKHVDTVIPNIGTILKYTKKEHLPLYRGCDRPLIQKQVETGFPGHGTDGLGDSDKLDR